MARVPRISVAVLCALLGWATGAMAVSLLVDDFDKGEKPNALGGDFGSWDKDPSDPTQKCTISFDKVEAMGGAGSSLRIDYDVDSPNPAYNGFWSKLQRANVSSAKNLSFYIKGDVSRGYTTQIKLELKNDKKEVGRYLLKGITDQWQKATIPLKSFEGITDWTAMTEFVIVFDDITSTKKVGSILIDVVTFES